MTNGGTTGGGEATSGGKSGGNAAGVTATGAGGGDRAGSSGTGGSESTPAGAAGEAAAAGNGGEGGDAPSCEHPTAFAAPNSSVAPYANVGAGFAMLGAKLALGYGTPAKDGPYLTLFDPALQTFSAPKLLSVSGVVPLGTQFHVALTTLSDGHLAAAWTDQGHCYLSLGTETGSPNALKLSDVGGLFYPRVAIAPFFDGRVAVAWKESGSGSYNYYVVLDIFDPSSSTQQKFRIEAPGKVDTAPRLYLTADRLVIELTQTIPLDSGDFVAKRNFFVATIGPSDVAGTIVATSFIPNSLASAAPLLIDASGARVAYASASQILLSDLDTSFALSGTPLLVMPWSKYSSEFDLFRDGAGEQVLFSGEGDGLHSAKLDGSHHPVGPQASFGDAAAYSTGMVRTSARVAAIWYQYLGATYVTPLCP